MKRRLQRLTLSLVARYEEGTQGFLVLGLLLRPAGVRS